MNRWTAADKLIDADVIRWTEGIFDRASGGKKATRIGERLVIAELQARTVDGWLTLLVRGCAPVRDDLIGVSVPMLQTETKIRRSARTILRGKPERLLWSDETARDAISGEDKGALDPGAASAGVD